MKAVLIAGVDEVGRGPLAGAVIASAVILNPEKKIDGLADSKILSEKKREALYALIKTHALAVAIGRAEHDEIDRINIFQATFLAMQRAVANLKIKPTKILVDGKFAPNFFIPTQAIIKGDQTIPAISAASIIAKVTRDREMILLDQKYPGYGFAAHKGYPTQLHVAALKRLGPCPIHRCSFSPVKNVIQVINEI